MAKVKVELKKILIADKVVVELTVDQAAALNNLLAKVPHCTYLKFTESGQLYTVSREVDGLAFDPIYDIYKGLDEVLIEAGRLHDGL